MMGCGPCIWEVICEIFEEDEWAVEAFESRAETGCCARVCHCGCCVCLLGCAVCGTSSGRDRAMEQNVREAHAARARRVSRGSGIVIINLDIVTPKSVKTDIISIPPSGSKGIVSSAKAGHVAAVAQVGPTIEQRALPNGMGGSRSAWRRPSHSEIVGVASSTRAAHRNPPRAFEAGPMSRPN
eukprot:m.421113 g.421113  ORF g.421113 m.421113 type:complete len:183 (+) comp33470_c0_seq1:400-948(+)